MRQYVFNISANNDAFFRQRVSQPSSLFDSKLLWDADTYNWDDQQVSGTATSTHNANQASVTLATANTTGVRVRQTKRRFAYQPGKSQLILMTGVLGNAVTNSTKRLGYFDDNNGLFFQQSTAGVAVGVRTKTSGAAVDTTVLQSNWNADKMDGTGSSGITLDFTKTQIFFIDFEWLGVGSVRYGFVVDGMPIVCHQINNANNLALVYMSTPNLPLRWELRTTANAVDSITAICATVISEGGLQETGRTISLDNTTSLTTGNNSNIYPLIGVRLGSSYLDAAVSLQALSVQCTSTAAYNWMLLLNPTVSGGSLSFSAVTGTPLEAALAPTNALTLSGGIAIASGIATQTTESSPIVPISSLIPFGSFIDGTADVVVLAARRLTGAAETFYASMQLRLLG